MYKRMVLIVLPVVLLMSFFGTFAVAQTTTPDAGVRGSGAIKTSTGAAGIFDINVFRTGTVFSGGFKYSEAASSTNRGNVIYSQQITGLTVTGNSATITAIGLWNGMSANLKIEALDDLSGDWFHISAVPRGPILILYDAQGGVVNGDIVVYSKAPVPSVYTKGEGTIWANKNVGRFSFNAQKIGSAVKGNLYYYEYNPLSMSIIERPVVKIYLPAVERLDCLGNTVSFSGRGTLNGMAALIEVRAKDYASSASPILIVDEFYITAMPLSPTAVSNARYEAGGPLSSGDVVIRLVTN